MLPIISNELTKTQIKVIANNTVNDIIDGGKDILKIADTLAKLELFIKELKANPEYMDYLIHEVSQYGKGTTTSTGTKLELAEVGVKYDYSQCNDPKLNQMELDYEALGNKISDRKEFLKTLNPKGLTEVDEETGETNTLYPPSKTSKSSVKCTIVK